ncbi:MAG: hypothetical protein KIT16_17505 [Rhodospirillaceae bacterium]|nr:hypothetical protein [Rhodospirillaceae bacterium]
MQMVAAVRCRHPARSFRALAILRTLVLTAALAALILAAPAARAQSDVSRTIVGLFDSKTDISIRRARLHRLAEMPLNHLGLILVSHDVRKGLPSEAEMRDVRGILTWFTDIAFAEPGPYLDWLEAQIREGRKLVIIGHPGVDPGAMSALTLRRKFDAVIEHLGLRWESEWVELTYASAVAGKDSGMVEFERPLPKLLPPYQRLALTDPRARAWLTVRRDGDDRANPLVVTGPNGGYISLGLAAYEVAGHPDVWGWQIDPFRFFRAAFATDDVPKLDTTTMSGRRLYYSHVDGDGWHNVSTALRYLGKQMESAAVLYEDVLKRTPDLPVTIAPISADLDDNWYGDERSRDLARAIFRLPQVEAGSHTHSHPFAWAFFRNADPRKEVRYLPLYPQRPGKSMADSVWNPDTVLAGKPPEPKLNDAIPPGYTTPRSYAVKPFDLGMEVTGSIRIIEALLPPGKHVELFQWSGDTSPFQRALEAVAAAGLHNINGGDSRMDGAYASYAQVAPLALRVGKSLQVYSSAANENIYTDNWRRRFFAYRGLAETMRRTESPIRVKPINIYYHFYSAEREEGLSALWFNIEAARRQEIAPIAASRFAAMVEGFYSANIIALGPRRWRIEDRGGIETVRFDHATLLAVDFARSEGVIGQRHFQGSLYVALDRAVATPVVALAPFQSAGSRPDAPAPYLVQSRWRVEQVTLGTGGGWRFRGQGFGRAEFAWKVPAAGRYAVTATAEDGTRAETAATAGSDGMLRFALDLHGERGVDFAVERK